MGGSSGQESVDNPEFLEGGAFFMFNRQYEAMTAAQAALESLQEELLREKTLRKRLEGILRKTEEGAVP